MTCETCVNYGFYRMITDNKPYGYSGHIPCITCSRYSVLQDKFIPRPLDEKEEKYAKDAEVVHYEISKDGIGLLACWTDGNYYHIHNNELTTLQKWILELLTKRGM